MVRLDDGRVLRAFPRGKRSEVACGDRVDVSLQADQARIEKLHERRSLLYRKDAFKEKTVAANVDQVVIVTATEPGFSGDLIARILLALEAQNVDALIVLNKCDLVAGLPAARAQLAEFAAMGYRVLELSARGNPGPLAEHLKGRLSVLIGQSGMGKSTLVNALIPGAAAATREISSALDSGKHTTTFARLYELPGGGELIDSPGLQEFGLSHLDVGELEQAFRDFRPYLGTCRFRDCAHDREPDCALRGHVPPGRLALYRTVRQEITDAARLNR
ncbi:MAG TPA: ribosome small subunit-dependent GTPase A [Methyloversatilis sp.]